jgi:TonB family protein
MNRLQKKCVIATAGFHLLLLVILFVGPAFFSEKPKLDDTPVLELISANTVDAATTGVKSAQQPPAPAPAVAQSQSQPTPPAPKPVVQQPAPTPTPQPSLAEKLEKFFTPAPVTPDLTPVEKTKPVEPHTPKVNLKLTTHTVHKNNSTPEATTSDNSRELKSELAALRKNLSSSTAVEMPGESSASASNYKQVVQSIYTQAWTPPDNTASDDANVKAIVTIASDGTVISAQIKTPSGDDSVDESVRRTLDRVTFIRPFPAGSTDKQRSYIINFNLKSKRMLG